MRVVVHADSSHIVHAILCITMKSITLSPEQRKATAQNALDLGWHDGSPFGSFYPKQYYAILYHTFLGSLATCPKHHADLRVFTPIPRERRTPWTRISQGSRVGKYSVSRPKWHVRRQKGVGKKRRTSGRRGRPCGNMRKRPGK